MVSARPKLNPLWTRAPLGLRHFPALLLSVLGSTALLTLALVVAPFYLSATANAGLRDALDNTGRFGAGYSIVRNDPIDPDYVERSFAVRRGAIRRHQNFATRDRILTKAFAGIDGVDDRVATIMGEEVTAAAGSRGPLPVRPIYRTGASEHVDVLTSVDGPGILLPHIIAEDLQVDAGESIRLEAESSGGSVEVRVKGVYSALSEDALPDYWQSLGNEIQLQLPAGVLPPPFVIASRAQTVDIVEALTPRSAQFRWEFPLEDVRNLDLDGALAIGRGFDRITSEIGRVRSRLGRLFWCYCFLNSSASELTTGIDASIRSARNRAASLEAPLDLLSNAGAVLALAVLGATGAYEVHRRRTEVLYLLTRGMPPSVLGARFALESVLPILGGVAAGYVGARILVSVVLSGAGFDDRAAAEAIRLVGASAGAAVLVILGASRVASRRQMRKASGDVARRSTPLWEVPVLGLAVYFLSSVLDEQSLIERAGGAPAVSSSLILLLPLALIGGVSGLAARLFKSIVGRARRWSRQWSDGVHLAVHRLASAAQLAVLLFSACGLALGTLVYSQTTGTTILTNTTTKAYVFAGSDVSVLIDGGSLSLPPSFPFPWTVATQVFAQASLAEGEPADIVAVDAATVTRAAYWNDSFADVSLEELSDHLGSSGSETLSVAATAGVPETGSVDVGGVEIPVRVADRVRAFPGMVAGRALVVVDSTKLRDALSERGGQDVVTGSGAFTQLWVKGEPSAIERALAAEGFQLDYMVRADRVLERPVFVSIRRSFTFLQILGLASSLMVVLGLLLYMQARSSQRTLSLALAARMGMTRRAHRSALGFELGSMLLIALTVGAAVGTVVSALIFKRLDPLPEVAPTPSLVLPLLFGAALLATLMLVTVAGALIADRAARRASVSEVLRYE